MDKEQIEKVKRQFSKYVSRQPQRLNQQNETTIKGDKDLNKSQQLIENKKRFNSIKVQSSTIYNDQAQLASNQMQEIKINFDLNQSQIFDKQFSKQYQDKSHNQKGQSLPKLQLNNGKIQSGSQNITKSSSKRVLNLKTIESTNKNKHLSNSSLNKQQFNLRQRIENEKSPKKKLDMQEELQRQKQQETLNILKQLQDRDCKKNIKKYKEEMDQIRYFINPYNVNLSFTNIENKINQSMEQKKINQHSDQTHQGFCRLSEYLRFYKQRLYLVPKHKILEDEIQSSNGMDYHCYKDIKIRGMDLLDVVKEHKHETEELFKRMGLSENLEQGSMKFFKKRQTTQNSHQSSQISLLNSVSSQPKITEKYIDNQLQNSTSFLGQQSKMHELETKSGDYFANLRYNYSQQKHDDEEIMRVAAEIEQKYYNAEAKEKKRNKLERSNQRFRQSIRISRKSSIANSSIHNIENQSNQNLYRSQIIDFKSDKNGKFQFSLERRKSINHDSIDNDVNGEHPDHMKNINSLTSIFHTCQDIEKEHKDIVKKYKRGHKKLRKTLNSCKNILEETVHENHRRKELQEMQSMYASINSKEVTIKL